MRLGWPHLVISVKLNMFTKYPTDLIVKIADVFGVTANQLIRDDVDVE